MSSPLKSGRYPIETRRPYEQRRIEEIKSIIEDGYNPFGVVLGTSGGQVRFTPADVANYFEHYNIPFKAVLRSFQLGGPNHERRRTH